MAGDVGRGARRPGLAVGDGDRQLLAGLEPTAEVVGLDQPVYHGTRVASRRDPPGDRPQGVTLLNHVGDPRGRSVGPIALGQAGGDQKAPGHDQHQDQHPGAQPDRPPLTSPLDTPGNNTWEHVFDSPSILPEHLFAVNLVHNIELVFASGQPRC